MADEVVTVLFDQFDAFGFRQRAHFAEFTWKHNKSTLNYSQLFFDVILNISGAISFLSKLTSLRVGENFFHLFTTNHAIAYSVVIAIIHLFA